ncbi:MAG: hypothetical protein ACYS9T_00785 [Planctomycetota bacterium]|jgi:hypothetical protein
MKRLVDIKEENISKPSVYTGLDTHKWATKMEIQRLLGTKPDLKLKAATNAINLCTYKTQHLV